MTPVRYVDVPEVLEVQVVPSEEVRIVPLSPTATKVLFAWRILLRRNDSPDDFVVHVVPFDEVTMVPYRPTVMKNIVSVINPVLVSY